MLREGSLVGLEGDNLEQQLEARDPDVRLMVQVRNESRGPSRPWSSAIRTGWWASCSTLVGNREEAEDLTQEVFLRIYKARKGYRPEAKFSTWLFTIANNLALNQLRTRAATRASLMGGQATGSRRSR